MELDNIILIVGFLIIIITTTFVFVIPSGTDETSCRSQGFDYAEDFVIMEEGYVKCCNIIYENHEEVDSICEGVKK